MVPCKADAGPEAWTPHEHRTHTTKIPINIWAGGMQFAGNEPVGNLAYLVHRLVAEISPFQNKYRIFQ